MLLRTLVSDPFAVFDESRLRGERHEITFDDEASVLLAEEVRRSPRKRRLARGWRRTFERHGGRQGGGSLAFGERVG